MHESLPGVLSGSDAFADAANLPLTEFAWSVVLGRLLLACVAGGVVARLAIGHRRGAVDDTLPITLMLMSVLIAMATQIIGDNIARAFSLVGALSIVRFRTALPETQDVAFVLTSVVVGMAIGAAQYAVAAIGLGVVALLLLGIADNSPYRRLARPVDGSRIPQPTGPLSELVLTVGPAAAEEVAGSVAGMCKSVRLTSAETIKRGAGLRLEYQVRLRPEFDAVLALTTLQQLPAVESVHLRGG